VSTVAPLFDRLIDDAALFPPGDSPMSHAVPAHLGHRHAPYAEIVGRFLCPASRLAELVGELPDLPAVEVGLVVDTGLAGLPTALNAVAAEPRLRLGAVEIALPVDDVVTAARRALAALPVGVPGYIEVPRLAGAEAMLNVLNFLMGTGVGAKYRTGGPTAAAFPSGPELATFLVECARRGLSFKCTAGLHRPVRHRDPETGFVHHGFVNVLLATLAAMEGDDVEGLLAATDGPALAELCWSLSVEEQYAIRAAFRGFGSCDMVQPMAGLAGLGLL